MDPLSLHTGVETYVRERQSRNPFDLVLVALRKSKDETLMVVHVRMKEPKPTTRWLLQRLGLLTFARCRWQENGECWGGQIPESMSLGAAADDLARMTELYEQAVDFFGQCGISIPAPSIESADRSRGPRPASFTDGHVGGMKSHRGNLEDEHFRYDLDWLEQEEPVERGWVVHYQEKTGSRNDGPQRVLRLLGLREYQSCPEFGFAPCRWLCLIVPSHGTFYDESAQQVVRNFDNHYRFFWPGVEALVQLESDAAELGMTFLPRLPTPAEEIQSDAARMPQGADPFGFVQHPGLRTIAIRDHADLLALLESNGELKAKIMLAGSVVEAILLDQIVVDETNVPERLLKMSLGQLVKEAKASGARVSAQVASMADAVKDFRNFGHPGLEIREGPIGQEDVDAAFALMKLVLRDARVGRTGK